MKEAARRVERTKTQRLRRRKHWRIEHTGDTVGNHTCGAFSVYDGRREASDGVCDSETAVIGGVEARATSTNFLKTLRCDFGADAILKGDSFCPIRVADDV